MVNSIKNTLKGTERLPTVTHAYWNAANVIFRLTLRQTFWNRKTVGMGVVAGIPVGIVILQRLFANMGTTRLLRFFPELVAYLYLPFVAMLFALFYGSAVIADEIENRTLTYLLVRPIPKKLILLSKYAAYLVGSGLIVMSSLFASFLGIYTSPRLIGQFGTGLQQFPQYALVVWGALMAYGAIYMLFGVSVRRPVLYGLIFFGWEKIVLVLPGVLRKFSVVHYLLSLFPAQHLPSDIRHLRVEGISGFTLWLVLLSIMVVFVGSSLLIFGQREYRLTE